MKECRNNQSINHCFNLTDQMTFTQCISELTFESWKYVSLAKVDVEKEFFLMAHCSLATLIGQRRGTDSCLSFTAHAAFSAAAGCQKQKPSIYSVAGALSETFSLCCVLREPFDIIWHVMLKHAAVLSLELSQDHVI